MTASQAVAVFAYMWDTSTGWQLAQELRGHDLACWCPLDQPCHADVLLELANSPSPGMSHTATTGEGPATPTLRSVAVGGAEEKNGRGLDRAPTSRPLPPTRVKLTERGWFVAELATALAGIAAAVTLWWMLT